MNLDAREIIYRTKTFARRHGLTLDQLHVSHGGALVLAGFWDATNDIDIVMDNPEDYERFTTPEFTYHHHKPPYELKYKPMRGNGCLVLLKQYDEVLPDDLITHRSGIRYRTLERTLKDKCFLDRPKDQITITRLRLKLSR